MKVEMEWIDANNGKPFPKQKCLLTDGNEIWHGWYSYDSGRWIFVCSVFISDLDRKVTHFMPFPLPPGKTMLDMPSEVWNLNVFMHYKMQMHEAMDERENKLQEREDKFCKNYEDLNTFFFKIKRLYLLFMVCWATSFVYTIYRCYTD